MIMENNSYHCSANLWNNSSDPFHTSSLDLPNYISSHRQHHFTQDANKVPIPASNPYGIVLNYSQEIPYQHTYHHCQANICNDQWQFPQWQSVKTTSSADPQSSKHFPVKSCDARNFITSDSMRNGVDNLPTTQNPATEFFSPNKVCDQVTDYLNKVERNVPHQTNSHDLNFGGSICKTNATCTSSSSSKNSGRRKNPAPKKRKVIKNKGEEKKKRCRNEDTWARNLRKKARAKGESYVSVLGKTVPARSVKPVDCSKCKFHCPDHVSEQDRQNLFKTYWGLGTFKEKVDFICDCVQEFSPLRPISGRRAHSRRYKLEVDGQKERVCKEFFLSTFGISESTIVTYMNKKRKNPEVIQDLRGKRTPSNKTPERVLRDIREHILSQIGLQGTLDKLPTNDAKNVKKLYSLYRAECEQDNEKPASHSMYRKVFTDMHRDKNGGPFLPVDFIKEELKKGLKKTSSSQPGDVSDSLQSSAVDCELSASSDADFPSQSLDTSSNHVSISQVGPSMTVSATDLDSPCIDEFTERKEREAAASMINLPFASGQQYYQPYNFEKLADTQSDCLRQTSFHYGGFNPTHSKSSHEQLEISLPSNNKRKLYNQQDNNRSSGHPNLSEFTEQYCEARTSHSVHQNQTISNFHSSFQPQFNSCMSNPEMSNFPYALPSSQLNTDLVKPKSQTITHRSPFRQKSKNSRHNKKGITTDKKVKKSDQAQNSKSNMFVKKRERKEETWARNVRKRLRFKGEEYTSVRGKKVEAKRVQDVDCSKCRFKCPSKMSEEQREEMNTFYWSLDSLEKRIAFITKNVQLYKPKRLMTGRRAFSRRYIFEVDKKEVRVCKDFFQATLHVSESTVATALQKSQRGPEAIKDLRGKHKPANKTSDETIQSICEIIIFITGLRPHRNNENHDLGHRIKSLYQAYKYDSESKGKKVASLGIFRSVLLKEFGISGNPKFAKTKKSEDSTKKSQNCQKSPIKSSQETSEMTNNSDINESDGQMTLIPDSF